MAEHVAVPRAALEHILDWHNKTPCGAGQDSLDEIVFGALKDALSCADSCPDPNVHEAGCVVLEATGRAARAQAGTSR